MIEINEKKVMNLFHGDNEISEGYINESDLIYGDGDKEEYTVEFIFNQTGEGEVVTPHLDTGLLNYLVENIKCYQGKYQEDGSMLVTPLITNINGYEIKPISYLSGEAIDESESHADFFTLIPTIYYRGEEIEEDKFKIKFSTKFFNNSHKVFGRDVLIGTFPGFLINSRFNSIKSYGANPPMTFDNARNYLAVRGENYYGFTSDEMGVLYFLYSYIYRDSTTVQTITDSILGINSLYLNWDNRNFFPNVSKSLYSCYVTHLDGTIETLSVPVAQQESFSKYHIGEYLNVIPKEIGDGIYGTRYSWIFGYGYSFYFPNDLSVGICADKSNTDEMPFSIRPCFKGKIVEMEDVELFKSLPVIN